MKLFSPALSKNGVGRTEPPKTAHPGDPNQWVSCASDIYEEVWADIMGELANAITGQGIALDGTKRNQLSDAIKNASPKYVENIQNIASGSGAQALIEFDLSGTPFDVPSNHSMVQIRATAGTTGGAGSSAKPFDVNVGGVTTGGSPNIQVVNSAGTVAAEAGFDTAFVWIPYDLAGLKTFLALVVNLTGGAGTTWTVDMIGSR